jgi:aryl-alcohol dehydrogenase-like predicted oxidoreductase
VAAAVATSLRRMRADRLDLLQFHWWDYAQEAAMLDALRCLHEERRAGRIRHLATTNMDTARLRLIVEAGIPIVANQVQYSLIDTRPGRRMAPFCAAHGIALLTYGTLGGGLLTERFLGAPEPRSKADLSTPSLGKYYNMVRSWGSWADFQALLRAVKAVADRHGVSMANVATRWVLDQPAVGGVLVGLRAGLSEHADDNARVFSFALTAADNAELAAAQARGRDLMDVIGDCGDEYRG